MICDLSISMAVSFALGWLALHPAGEGETSS